MFTNEAATKARMSPQPDGDRPYYAPPATEEPTEGAPPADDGPAPPPPAHPNVQQKPIESDDAVSRADWDPGLLEDEPPAISRTAADRENSDDAPVETPSIAAPPARPATKPRIGKSSGLFDF
jgi:hypothetical protein